MMIYNDVLNFMTIEHKPGSAFLKVWDGYSYDSKSRYPLIRDMENTPQDDEYHPEGNVLIHCCLAADEASRICHEQGIIGRARDVLVAGALLHDIAKPDCTTTKMKKGKLRIVSPQHDTKLGRLNSFMSDQDMFNNNEQKMIYGLARLHMRHLFLPESPSRNSVRKVYNALKKYGITVEQLAVIVEADHSSRPPRPKNLPKAMSKLVVLVNDFDPEDDKPKPKVKIVTGQDLIDAGFEPGTHFKDMLDMVHRNCTTREEALDFITGIWFRNFFGGAPECMPPQ